MLQFKVAGKMFSHYVRVKFPYCQVVEIFSFFFGSDVNTKSLFLRTSHEETNDTVTSVAVERWYKASAKLSSSA
jgi:hypothetical protein